jgi:DUF971 family protein
VFPLRFSGILPQRRNAVRKQIAIARFCVAALWTQQKGAAMIDRLSATPDHRHLIVEWENGATSELSAMTLRREARDAYSKREKLDHGEIAVAPDLTITDLIQVGVGGLNVHFSDGHERAIYPFVYLRELSDQYGN